MKIKNGEADFPGWGFCLFYACICVYSMFWAVELSSINGEPTLPPYTFLYLEGVIQFIGCALMKICVATLRFLVHIRIPEAE